MWYMLNYSPQLKDVIARKKVKRQKELNSSPITRSTHYIEYYESLKMGLMKTGANFVNI